QSMSKTANVINQNRFRSCRAAQSAKPTAMKASASLPIALDQKLIEGRKGTSRAMVCTVADRSAAATFNDASKAISPVAPKILKISEVPRKDKPMTDANKVVM